MVDLNSTAEQNARMRARADYFRWLNKYHGSAELAEMSDEPEPVNLRQIFVPMRVAKEDIAETDMAQPDEVVAQETDANLPGRDAFELIAEQPFICLSGLPGSGKTTLTKALIGELCGNHPSSLRTALQAQRGIAPIPLILREISGIDRILTLDALMEAWWQNLEQKTEQADALDIARLRYSFNVEGDHFPLLLLFDGIDEIGGADVRQILLDIAVEAHDLGCRVLVTGRPNGFADVYLPRLIQIESDHWFLIREEDSANLFNMKVRDELNTEISLDMYATSSGTVNFSLKFSHYHLLPLAWPQIHNFIDRWYRLRPEWQIKRKDGTDHFLEALQDNNRPYLLTLARRPIFLTLMALVHCTRNEMPHGRADLYEAIVDLYLNRQERHRQLKCGINGNLLKAWSAQEKRRVLGRIAFESQLRGADRQEDDDNSDQRRILWPQPELRDFIADYLQERAGSGGILPEDADELLDYYLHPAGLLISPREGEISFAHLSFQEYLCAEDIQRRLSGRQFEAVFRENLAERLNRPGWDEVGLLLLAIHKNRSEDGHLELLGLLQPHKTAEASLLVRALCGKELGITPARQQAWLPVLLAACLLHPEQELAGHLADCPHLEQAGLALVLEFLNPPEVSSSSDYAEAQWRVLQQRAKSIERLFAWSERHEAMLEQWRKADWNKYDGSASARFYSLLVVLVCSNWGLQDDVRKPIADPALESALSAALQDRTLLWRREKYEQSAILPVATNAGMVLNALLPDHGMLWQCALAQLPVDAWLLQGEMMDENLWGVCSQPTVLLALYPEGKLPARARLALGLYQALSLMECLPLLELWASRSRSLSRSWSRSRSWPRSWSRSLSLLRSLSLSLSRLRLRLRSRSRSRSLSLALALSQSAAITKALRQLLQTCVQRLTSNVADEPRVAFARALERFGYFHAAHDWFSEQAEAPDLMTRRGLRPAEPLPSELGLFDQRGMPLSQQQRHHWLQLQAWLLDDDAVLAFFFPEGLGNEDEVVLRADLALLKTQPWSPQAFVAAALDAWPENQAQRDFSFAGAQDEMLAACQAFLLAAG